MYVSNCESSCGSNCGSNCGRATVAFLALKARRWETLVLDSIAFAVRHDVVWPEGCSSY